MITEVIIHESAEEELYEAAEYYDSQVPGLGHAFLLEIQQAIHFIQFEPESSPRIYKVVRKRVLRRFPYNILYSVKNDVITILAIASQRRRPFYWRNRK
jgi:mRNA-degrading endonuclease RelE of RelBE toxin-antitoxin system